MVFRTHNLQERLKKRLCWIRWSDVLRCRRPIRTNFMYPGHRIKWLGRSQLSDVLNRRMALRTQNLPSGRLKRRLWQMWWSVVSTCWRVHVYPFSASRESKKWLSWSRLSYVWNIRMTLRTQNLASARLKRRHWRSRWFVVSRCRLVKRSYFLHSGKKIDFHEFD
jgi:hypothetical protein